MNKVVVYMMIVLLFHDVASQELCLVTVTQGQKRLQEEIVNRWKNHERALQSLQRSLRFQKATILQNKVSPKVKKREKVSKSGRRVQEEIDKLDKTFY